MTDTGPDEMDARIAARQNRLAGGPAGSRGAGRGLLAAGIVVLMIVAGALLLAPNQIRDLIFGTSESEEFQTTSTVDPGLSTQFSTPPTVDTEGSETIDTAMPEAAPEDPPALPTDAADAERLRALQDQLDRLIAAQGEQGVDPAEIERLLDAQAARLQTEFEQQRALQQRLHEQQMAAARAAAVPTGPTADELAEQEAQQRLAEERARRAAINEEQVRSPALLFDRGGNGLGGALDGADRELTDNEAFLSSASRQPHETVQATTIPNPSRTIVQGSIIEAVLETALTTELPGTLRAITSVDVYSYNGEEVLLPRGSRLIGTYSSDISVAQGRVLIAWNRAITPDGTSVALGGVGGDPLGRSGQTGFVDTRFGLRFGTAALISFIGIAPVLLVDDDSGEAEQEIAEDVTQDLRNTSSSVLEEYLSLPPIIYVDQGTEITVFVNRDLVF